MAARKAAAGDTLADQRVRAARVALVLDQPFFGMLALQLQLVNDASCQTAWTDGKSLGYSPAFVAGLTDDALQGLIAHEVMHCALGHPWRRGGRDHKRFNQAADYALNAPLVEAGFTLPAGALLSPEFSGHCAEWIFDRLPDGGPDGGGGQKGQQAGQDASGGANGDADGEPGPDGDAGQDGQDGGPDGGGSPDTHAAGDTGQPGEVRDAPGDAGAPSEADWAQAVEQAAKICEGRGTMPGGLTRGLAAATAPVVDWRAALRRYVQDVCTADYTWTRPSTRYLAGGLFLPSLRAERCGRIVVAVDTSGSIDETLLGQFSREIQAIADEVQPSRIDVVYCDSEISGLASFEPGEPVELVPQGGGGTAFEPVFDHVNAADEAPAVLIYLTDLDGSFPAVAPEYPVIWAAVAGYGPRDVPFGDLIDVE